MSSIVKHYFFVAKSLVVFVITDSVIKGIRNKEHLFRLKLLPSGVNEITTFRILLGNSSSGDSSLTKVAAIMPVAGLHPDQE